MLTQIRGKRTIPTLEECIFVDTGQVSIGDSILHCKYFPKVITINR